MSHDEWMLRAVKQARAGLADGQSPFGAVLVRGGRLVAAGHNEVVKACDPTAHAEVVAIRRGAAALGGIDLRGCVMYTTCEPCPMCAAAIHWAKLDEVYFGATIAHAAAAGFSELRLPAGELYARGRSPVRATGGILAEQCAALFAEWLARPDRVPY